MKKIILFFLSLFFLVLVNAQHTNIKISDLYDPEEPSIMLNPKNTNEIVAAANIKSYYTSTNGGNTWAIDTLSSTYGVWGDPCIIVDTTESFYFIHLSDPKFGNWIDRIVCQKKDSISGAWNDGSYVGLNGIKAQDKAWAIVDRKNNIIYMTWTQFDKYGVSTPTDSSNILFSRSVNGGNAWTVPVRLNKKAGNCVDSDSTTEGAVPAVGPNGEVYVAWAGPAGIRFDRSLDSGNTWLSNDIFVNAQPTGWDYMVSGLDRCNGLPITVCDLSNSPHCGNIYINWSDQRNGSTDTDIWLSKSTDGGNTWSSAKRVNDDPPGNQQFLTWMTVDQVTGYLWFVFYDRRNYTGDETEVYLAVSKDGGESFINYKISQSPFTPIEGIFFGDYTNISAYNNVIRPIWTRLQNGQLSVWTAIIDTTLLGIDSYDLMGDFSLEQNNPNPFNDNTYISFKLHRPAVVSLKVYDIYGREMAILINNENYNSGKYIRHFDAGLYDLSSGTYYFSLISNEKILTRKMLLLK